MEQYGILRTLAADVSALIDTAKAIGKTAAGIKRGDGVKFYTPQMIMNAADIGTVQRFDKIG